MKLLTPAMGLRINENRMHRWPIVCQCRLGTFLLAVLMFSISSSVYTAELQFSDALQLSAEGKFDKVIASLKKAKWNASQDPRLLLAYCSAQYQISDQSSTCHIRDDAPIDAKLFADALWATWTGRISQARVNLDRLEKDNDWSWFGRVGRLELASYLENESELGDLIKQYKPLITGVSPSIRFAYESYRSKYADLSIDWSGCSTIQRQYSKIEIGRHIELFSTCFHSFQSAGDLSHLTLLMNSASPALRRTKRFRTLNSMYINMTKTPEEGIKADRKLAAASPQDKQLAFELANIDAYSNVPEESARAMEWFKSEADKRANDPKLILEMGVTAATAHKPKEAGEIYKKLNTRGMDLNQFLLYRVMIAWNSIYNGDVGAAKAQVDKLTENTPHSIPVNLLKALIAKRQNDAKAGGEALHVLYYSDPFNENFIELIVWFSERFSTDEILSLLSQVRQKSHFYSKDLQSKLTTIQLTH